jgi:hypothetical protein
LQHNKQDLFRWWALHERISGNGIYCTCFWVHE